MNTKTTLNIRIDAKLKKDADCVIDELGLSTSSAVVLFLKAVIRERGIPFEIKIDGPKKTNRTSGTTKKKRTLLNDKNLQSYDDDDSIRAAIEKL